MPTEKQRPIAQDDDLLSAKGLDVCAFRTPIGYIGLVTTDAGLVATRVGYQDLVSLEQALGELLPLPAHDRPNALGRRLLAYTQGKTDPFSDVELDRRFVTGGNWTPFRDRVTTLCRSIPRGQVMSYLDLAEEAGAPRAARAVGTVMSRNPWPIIVPCHRVVGSGGSLGGYSAPTGLAFKRQLLQLEAGSAPTRMLVHESGWPSQSRETVRPRISPPRGRDERLWIVHRR